MPANLSSASAAPAITSSASAAGPLAQLIIPSPAVSSPTTFAITLTQPPPPVDLWQNGTAWVAGCALLGVFVTVLFAHLRMRSELTAAADRASAERDLTREQARTDRETAAAEAHKERIATTRRAVYLEAAEAIAKAQYFIASLPGLNLAALDFTSNLGPLADSVNKITIVGELETVRLSRDLMKTIMLTFMQAMANLLPMGQHKSELAFHSSQLEAAQLEVKRILVAMQSHNESRSTDREDFGALMASFNFHQKRCETEASEIQLRHSRIALEQQGFSAFMLERTRELATSLDLLADSVRREMSIPTDLETFQAISTAMWESARDAQVQLNAKVEEFQAGNITDR